jgi:hypothetical protein
VADADRAYVSQYSSQDMGISVLVASNPTNADGPVTVTVFNEDTQAVDFTRIATNVGVGAYQITLTPDDTAVLGNYSATWAYTLSGSQKTFVNYFAIGGAEPAYDKLSPDMKAIVDQVWVRLSDLFDSPAGGPNLQTWAQSNFNRGRVAQLLPIAVGILNTVAQPFMTYTVDGVGGAEFPVVRWGPLLAQSLWVETVKHLRRSYLEQPSFEGGGISRLDRRDYFERWGEILSDEQLQLERQLEHFKIANMGLGRPSVLLSGGIFGRYNSINRPYMASRPRLWFANLW